MTWTKLGAEFWDQLADAGLSDAAVRTHAEAIGWLYGIDRENVADLSIPKSLVRRFAGSSDFERGVQELVSAGFWLDVGTAYHVDHHGDVIRSSLAAQRKKRERDKLAQRRHRDRESAATSALTSATDAAATQTDRQTGSYTEPENREREEPERPLRATSPASAPAAVEW